MLKNISILELECTCSAPKALQPCCRHRHSIRLCPSGYVYGETEATMNFYAEIIESLAQRARKIRNGI